MPVRIDLTPPGSMDIKQCMVKACSPAGGAAGSWSETNGAAGKRYVVELQPEFGCFTPTFIAVSFGKTVLFKVLDAGLQPLLMWCGVVCA